MHSEMHTLTHLSTAAQARTVAFRLPVWPTMLGLR